MGCKRYAICWEVIIFYRLPWTRHSVHMLKSILLLISTRRQPSPWTFTYICELVTIFTNNFVFQYFADYIEKKASSLGLQMLFLLTTRTADWYSLFTFHPFIPMAFTSLPIVSDILLPIGLVNIVCPSGGSNRLN